MTPRNVPQPDMSRRATMTGLAVGLSGAWLAPHLAIAGNNRFTANRDYEIIANSIQTEAAAGRIEVREFFAYWCPYCYRLESRLNDWETHNRATVTLVHTAIARHDAQIPLQCLFYVLDRLGGA